MRKWIREFVAANPRLDSQFRRRIWSRVHFPEAELRVLNSLPAESLDYAIDVGAALGSYTWVLARKARCVVAYEPGQRHADALSQAIRGTCVSLVRAAVGASKGEMVLYTPGDTNDGRHMATLSVLNPVARDANAIKVRVPVVSLDEDLGNRVPKDRRIDLLKIDVEGFENAVISGARNMLARDCPLVIVEIEARHNPDYVAAFQLLHEQGYSAHYWADGAYVRMDGTSIEHLQTPEGLQRRLANKGSGEIDYVNNFVFQHPRSRIKLA